MVRYMFRQSLDIVEKSLIFPDSEYRTMCAAFDYYIFHPLANVNCRWLNAANTLTLPHTLNTVTYYYLFSQFRQLEIVER